MTQTEIQNPYPASADHRPLRRPHGGRVVAGVASGVAEYLGLDTAVVRIALVVLTFVGGLGIPAYLAGWLLIPDEDHAESNLVEWLDAHR